jgi:hypothetical protein
MEIQTSQEITGLPITIQCTWANCFTEPDWDRGLCIRSYDRKELARLDVGEVIGKLTGAYCIDEHDTVWLEAQLYYCDRRPTGWFRERDVYHAKKADATKNPDDTTVTTPTTTTDTTTTTTTKSNNWLYWLSGGLAALKLFGGI